MLIEFLEDNESVLLEKICITETLLVYQFWIDSAISFKIVFSPFQMAERWSARKWVDKSSEPLYYRIFLFVLSSYKIGFPATDFIVLFSSFGWIMISMIVSPFEMCRIKFFVCKFDLPPMQSVVWNIIFIEYIKYVDETYKKISENCILYSKNQITRHSISRRPLIFVKIQLFFNLNTFSSN